MHMKTMQDIGKICMKNLTFCDKKLAKTKMFCKRLFWWESETAQKQRYPGAVEGRGRKCFCTK